MTFRWLPDAELDPHPRLTWFGECCFGITISSLYRIDAIYPPDYRLDPNTLVVSNHLRDVDVPIIAAVLCRRRGLQIDWPMPFFASREDLFKPDFLSEYLEGWPRPIQRFVGRFPLLWLFRIMRGQPIRRVREFTLSEAFSELPRTNDRRSWLNRRGRHELDGEKDVPPAEEDEPPDSRDWGLRRLHGHARQTLAPDFRATVATQLERLAQLLDEGRIVYLAPEGRNSRDGRFGRIRAGAWQLVQRAETPPTVQPLALSYDALQGGRLRAVANVGARLESYTSSQRGAFDQMLKRTLRELYPVNTSHLVSRFLAAGPVTFTTSDFADWLEQSRGQLTSAGITLDPKLTASDAGELAVQRLSWLRRKKLVTRNSSGWRNYWPVDAEPGWQRPADIIRYCDNALDDHLQAVAPDVRLGL